MRVFRLLGGGAQHAGQGSSASARGAWLPGMRTVQGHRQRQGLLQRGGVGRQPCLGFALDGQAGGDVAALQALAGGFAQGGLEGVPAGGQAEAQVEAAAVDAAQLPGPGEAVGTAFGAGKSGHRGERGGHGGLVSAEEHSEILSDG